MPALLQPRRLQVSKTIFLASVLIALFVYAYFIRDPVGPANPVFRGLTMGTTYEVKIAGSAMTRSQVESLYRDIEELLQSISGQMSTYLPESEISRFNRRRGTEPYSVSPPLARVVSAALELAAATGGAFDPTLDPLISLWGFGPDGAPDRPPAPEEIAGVLAVCGYRRLEADEAGTLRKSVAGLALNLNAIAKGYGVDAVSDLLARKGLANTYVEIGGEVRVRGVNLEGVPWRIGIDVPRPGAAPGEQMAAILALSGSAVATSGDYRNFYLDAQGGRRMHIIDPRNGCPATNRVAGATVVAATCMEADGAATALMVLGETDGLAWVNERQGLETLLIIRNEDGAFRSAASPGFQDYLEEIFLDE